MKHLKNQRGLTGILEVAIVVLVLGALGFVGYRAYQARLPKVTELSTIAPNRVYENKEYGFKFSYPKEWGEATLKKGPFYPPGQGDYQQLTFSKQPKIDINFVLGSFSTPLDGCPGFLTLAKHGSTAHRGSIIGWVSDSLKGYHFTYDTNNTPTSTVDLTKLSTPNDEFSSYAKLKTVESVLIYQEEDKTPYEATQSYCGDLDITQAEVDEANSYSSYTHFALNFETSKVKGVNAHIDERSGAQKDLYDPLAKVLNSMAKL